MITTIQKWGNSQGLRFSKAVLAEANIDLGEEVRVSVEAGRIIVEPVRRVRGRYALADLVAQIPDDYEPEDVDWGEPVGNEAW